MNILFLYGSCINPNRGGVQRVTFVLANEFERRENIKVLFLSLNRPVDNKQNDPRQLFLPNSNSFLQNENILFFKKILIDYNIHIVVNQGGIDPICSQFAYHSTKIGVKLISVVHNSLLASINNFSTTYADIFNKYHCAWLLPITDIMFVKRFILELYRLKYAMHYRNLCNNSDQVVLLSDRFKDELSFFIQKYFLRKVVSIANPCSFNIKYHHCIKNNELLYVGRISIRQKRVDILLKIWSLLYEKYSGWKLTIVGGGDDLERIKKMAFDLKLRNIHFEGFNDPSVFYKRSSILCMTSAYEGFGMVLIEAMHYGVVPIAFNSFLSINDIINNKQNGVLIEPFDISHYANELSLLMEDAGKREQYAKEAIIKSIEFNVEIVANKWMELFNNLVEGMHVVK